MATKNIVPRADNEGGIGTTSKKWADVETYKLNNAAIQTVQCLQVAADQTSNSTALADITALNSFALAAGGTYHFRFFILATASATTESTLFSVNASAAVTSINYIYSYATSATAWTQEAVAALQGGTLPAGSSGATPRIYQIEGVVVANGAATMALQFKTETGAANTSTCETGTYGIVTRIS